MSEKYADMANAIRFLSADAIEKSNSGHPGMPLGMADVATVLFSKFLKINPKDPHWFDRDRFVLSAGHGSMLIYSLLYLLGYKDIDLDDIKNFRQLGAKTAGHPEYGHLAGIDMTTGPLGQGISSAVGMALAERIVNAKFGNQLCSHYTYVINGDGCLMEGISEEAASLAGHLKLNKLIVLWDNNNITIDGAVEQANSTNQLARFEAMGWNTFEVDGHNYAEIEKTLIKARQSDKPVLISCKTKIGFGAPTKCGTSKCHGAPLGAEEVAAMRKNLNWQYEPFVVPAEILNMWRSAGKNSEKEYESWCESAKKAGKTFSDYIAGILPTNWADALQDVKRKAIAEKTKVATRKASQMCLEAIVPAVPQIVGGSADLAASNLTSVPGMDTITAKNYGGNNLMYGIREHAMGAIMNGLALHGGIIPYGGTFFVFSDYMRPAMRLAAIMGIRAIYVLTHDSIGVGEDGPTHQPIEHLASYRAMPNINTFRPCDVVETAEAWQIALESETTPSVLALSRQNLPLLRTSSAENLTLHGGYVISDVLAGKERQATLIATGSEVSLAVEAQKILREKGIETAVVSMPCTELFDNQPAFYQESVLGNCPRVAIEAAAKFGWEKYTGLDGDIIGMDGFGASGPAGSLYEYFGITAEEVVESVENLLK